MHRVFISYRDVGVFALLAIIGIAQGMYAVRLNRDFYKEHAPFFDSCSYTKQLATIAAKTRSMGVEAAIRDSLSGNVALPYIETILISRSLPPSRAMGVWLQSVWLIALLLSVYWYLADYRKIDRWLAALLALPFVSFARVYDWNGGLPDFRMDLSLYIFVSLTAVWYLATYETESRIPWLLAGTSAMLACLARATSPVYLLLMIGPLFLIRLLMNRTKRRALLVKSLWMGLPITISAGIFLMYNFSYLYFYYVTWGPDENRNLSWRDSAIHLSMAKSHVGTVLIGCALIAFAIHIACIRRSRPAVDFKLLWLMLASPLFLVIRGVGLNPFVSMPAVFGFLMFAAVPFKQTQPALRYGWARVAIGILFALGALASAATSQQPQPYSGISTTHISGVRTLIDMATQHALSRGVHEIKFIAPELGEFHSCMISNVLIYEYGATPRTGNAITHGAAPVTSDTFTTVNGMIYGFPSELIFTASDELFWKINVEGTSQEEMQKNVVAMMAADTPNYLLLPDEQTLDWLEHDRGFYFINRQTRSLKSRLLELNRWVSVGNPIPIDANERIQLFAPRDGSPGCINCDHESR